MISQLYLGTDHVLMQKRIDALVRRLETENDKTPSEVALETIGNSCLPSVVPLLKSADKAVRFHAARCILNLDDNRGFDELRKIIHDRNSEYRITAINAIGAGTNRNEAVRNLNTLLNDSDYGVRFTAYENLRNLNVFAVTKQFIAGNFFLETVISPGAKSIYVTRKGAPKIVLFGSPFKCSENIFAKSEDGTVVINGQPGEKFISIMRKHPTRPTLIGPFSSSYSVKDVVRTLGEMPVQPENSSIRPGLGVTYSEIIMMLERMCSDEMINARFDAGPMTSIETVNQPKVQN
jgi:hypothetical protein